MININEKETKTGVNFINITSDKECDSVIALGDEKSIFKGTPAITLMEKSYKYGKQIQFKIFARKGSKIVKKKRNKSEWDTIEIDIPYDEGLSMLAEALRLM